MHESQIFLHALKLATPDERVCYLDEACGGDQLLRAAVDALLRGHETNPDFLEQPASSVAETVDVALPAMERAEQPGVVLAGRYKLLEAIGEGGMGTVWMAQQTEPIKRLVAVKLIKAGMDSKAVLARFEAERQALALMDHPNIARVLDAGAIPDGRPFFVMELVKGVSITKYCDEHHLTPRQRLELFVPVCQAIQHAHQKGIIHRDVKPSNILVALYDDRPVPKVIDFGVAKATGQQLTEITLHTGFGAVVGTVEYMSPEQASFNQLDVDTRSDIYSLGILLYELLAGSPPFSRKELEQAGMLEMLRVIREQVPSKPSTKLSTADGLPTLAANRGMEPKRLAALVRGELDWIVMKAVEKDRGRRYETANGLALDVQRYLADEPVLAGPPSTTYRLRKFVRRNKRGVLAASLVMLALIVGMIGTTYAMFQASRERDSKDAALRREQRTAYFRLVALAHRELEANVVGRADQLLEECPEQLRGWEWRYLKRLRFGGTPVWKGGGGPVMDFSFGRDGPIAAAPNMNRQLALTDVSSGKRLTVLDADQIECVAFNSTGRLVATGGVVNFPVIVPLTLNGLVCSYIVLPGRCAEIRVSDAATGRKLLSILDHDNSVFKVSFAPDDRWLASANSDGLVKIRDSRTGQTMQTMSGHTSYITRLEFSPDGKWLASSSFDESVRIWECASGRSVHILPGHRDGARNIAFSPDSRLLASVGLDSKVRLWNVATGEMIHAMPHPAPTYSVAFSPDGQRLAVGGWDYAVKLWDMKSFEEILTLRGHANIVHRLMFGPDGHQLVSGSIDGTVCVWDGKPLGDRAPWERFAIAHKDCIFAVAFRNDGDCLATADLDRSVILWEPHTGQQLRTLTGHTGLVWDVKFSPDQRHLASASFDGTAKIWDTRSGEVIHTFKHDDLVNGVSYCPDGLHLATGSSDKTVRIWNTSTGELENTYKAQSEIQALAYSPDGRFVVCGHANGRITVWDAISALDCPFSPLIGHSDVVRTLDWSKDGNLIASACYDGSAKVWDAVTGQEKYDLRGHKERVLAASFSADSRWLGTAGIDASVKVWDMTTGHEIHTFRGQAGMVFCLAFSPNGRELIVGSGLYGKGELRIWDTAALDKNRGQEHVESKK